MLDVWRHDLESLEAVAQDETTRLLCLRMAAMSQAGTLGPFLDDIDRDGDLDHFTKATIAEIASDEKFLLALEDYVHRTSQAH